MSASIDTISQGDLHYKGYFADATALTTAYPTASNGDFAELGSTDTIWVWDSGTVAWVDTGTAGGPFAALSGATFTGDVIVPDEAYDATAWNGNLEVPTKNAIRDKIEALSTSLSANYTVTNVTTDRTFNADSTTIDELADVLGTVIADMSVYNGTNPVSDTAYGAGWNGDTTSAPSKNAVYDKIESMGGSSQTIALADYSGPAIIGVLGVWNFTSSKTISDISLIVDSIPVGSNCIVELRKNSYSSGNVLSSTLQVATSDSLTNGKKSVSITDTDTFVDGDYVVAYLTSVGSTSPALNPVLSFTVS